MKANVDELLAAFEEIGFKVLRCDQTWGEWRAVIMDNETPGQPHWGGAGATAGEALLAACQAAGIGVE